MDDSKVIVQVDKTVVKISGIDVKGLNIQQLEKIIKDKLQSVVRIIGVTGSSLEMDVYGIEEEDVLRESDGLIKAISLADGITLTDLAQISSVSKIKTVDINDVPEYEEGQCMKERWL
ncbi:MAG: hypothetical protein PUD43_01425 [Clostridia bacterium]|nr:hypothetical protein [Clostridia bacterium]